MNVVDAINYSFANLVQTENPYCNYEKNDNCTAPGNLSINSHSKVQFSLSMQDIIEVVDSNVWNADNFSSSCSTAHNAARNSYMGNNDAINVYFMQSNCDYEKKVLLSNINCSSPNCVQNGTACANYPSTTLSETLCLNGRKFFFNIYGKA